MGIGFGRYVCGLRRIGIGVSALILRIAPPAAFGIRVERSAGVRHGGGLRRMGVGFGRSTAAVM